MLQQTSCLTGHNKPIQETRWLFPGALTSTAHEMLLTSSLDRTVRMWDLRSKKVSLCLDFHADLRTIERDGQICAPILPIQILGCNRYYLPVAVGSDICFSDIRMCRSLRVPILPYTQLETSEYHFQEPSTPLADEGNIAFFSEHIIAFESGAMVFSHESMGRESTRMEVIEIDTSEHQPVMCIGNGGSSWCIFGTADEVVHFEQLASHTTGASDAYPARFFYRTRDDWNTQKKREMVNPAFPLSIATLNVTGTNELNTFIGTGDGYIHIIQHHTEDYVSQDYNCTHTDPSLAVEIDAELTLLAHEGSACISVGVDDRKTRMLTASHGGQVTVWNLGSLMQCENAGDDECAEELVTLNVFETRSRGLLNDLDTLFTGITMLQVALCTNIPVDDSQSEQYPLMVYQGY